MIGVILMEKHFGEILRELREKRGLGVNQLAMQSGVSSGLISKIENKERGTPKPDTIEKLAKGLKIKYEELMALADYTSLSIKERDESALSQETISVMEKMIAKHGADFTDPEAAEMLENLVKYVAKTQKKD